MQQLSNHIVAFCRLLPGKLLECNFKSTWKQLDKEEIKKVTQENNFIFIMYLSTCIIERFPLFGHKDRKYE